MTLKNEILAEFRLELDKFKQEILAGTYNILLSSCCDC